MLPRIVFSIVLVLAADAACSGGGAIRPSPPAVSRVAGGVPYAAAEPLDYVYALEYHSVSQWAFDPSASPMMRKIAPNYELPATCEQTDQLVAVRRDNSISTCALSTGSFA